MVTKMAGNWAIKTPFSERAISFWPSKSYPENRRVYVAEGAKVAALVGRESPMLKRKTMMEATASILTMSRRFIGISTFDYYLASRLIGLSAIIFLLACGAVAAVGQRVRVSREIPERVIACRKRERGRRRSSRAAERRVRAAGQQFYAAACRYRYRIRQCQRGTYGADHLSIRRWNSMG